MHYTKNRKQSLIIYKCTRTLIYSWIFSLTSCIIISKLKVNGTKTLTFQIECLYFVSNDNALHQEQKAENWLTVVKNSNVLFSLTYCIIISIIKFNGKKHQHFKYNVILWRQCITQRTKYSLLMNIKMP